MNDLIRLPILALSVMLTASAVACDNSPQVQTASTSVSVATSAPASLRSYSYGINCDLGIELRITNRESNGVTNITLRRHYDATMIEDSIPLEPQTYAAFMVGGATKIEVFDEDKLVYDFSFDWSECTNIPPLPEMRQTFLQPLY